MDPSLPPPMPAAELDAIERAFHALVRARADVARAPRDLPLPRLADPPLEGDRPWFPIPGMYGGFTWWWEVRAGRPVLVTESWSRIVGGSGQRHELDADGTRLVEEGFV